MTKLQILTEHRNWLVFQLEEVLNRSEYNIKIGDIGYYKINENTRPDVSNHTIAGYSLVLELRKELVKTNLAIIEIEGKNDSQAN